MTISSAQQRMRETTERIVTQACELSGLDRKELIRRCNLVGWHPAFLADRIENDSDWATKLADAAERAAAKVRAESATRLERCIDGVLTNGPKSMLKLDDPALLALIPKNLRDVAADWQPAAGGLLLLGPTGIGKSATALFVARRLVREAYSLAEHRAREAGDPHFLGIVGTHFVVWARSVDLALARSQHALGSEPPLVAQAKKPTTLIIDDLGWEGARDTTIPEVIADRYDAGRQTIVTSGRTWSELVERYGEALLRRVLECGGVKGRLVSLFPAKDARGK